MMNIDEDIEDELCELKHCGWTCMAYQTITWIWFKLIDEDRIEVVTTKRLNKWAST